MEPYWDYEDLGAFLFVLVFLGAVVRLAVRVHLLRPSELAHSSLVVQSLTIVLLTIALYTILKLRYHQPVMKPLGWRIPTRLYAALSIFSGLTAALFITGLIHLRHHVMPAIPAMDFFILGLLLGPILEESVFRGCLLPVVARTLGNIASVLALAFCSPRFMAPAISSIGFGSRQRA
jgi:membrane protease YdiL (CAAX protease family)